MRSAILIIAAFAFAEPLSAQTVQLFSVGSGNLDGGYFNAARAICDVVNGADRTGLRCSPEVTPGSLYNLIALGKDQLDLALVQSDWQSHAFRGTSLFAARGPMVKLRSVMSLYPEPFTLIARRDVRIADFSDLVGKRVDIGPPSSGRQATMRAVMEVFGVKLSDFHLVFEMSSNDAIEGLCAGRIDATVLIAGHPNAAVARALDHCNAEIVSLSQRAIERLTSGNGVYSRSSIAPAVYASQRTEVESVAVMATVVTLSTANDDLVEAFVRNTLLQIDVLRRKAPILATLDPHAMRTLGLTAPLHPAAIRAFDRGLARSQ